MFLYCLIFKREMLKVKVKDLWIFACAGFISMDFFTVCYFSTIQATSLSVAAVLLYAAPAIVMLLSLIIFKEKLSVLKCVSCVVAFLGCALVAGIIGSGTAIPGKALLTGLLSALGYALYSIFGEIALRRGYKPMTITTYTFLFATVGALFFLRPQEIGAAASVAGHLKFFGIMAIMSIMVSLLPYILYTNGLTFIRPSKASIIASVEPVTATVIGIVIFSEKPDIFGMLGIVCVVGAIALLNISPKKPA